MVMQRSTHPSLGSPHSPLDSVLSLILIIGFPGLKKDCLLILFPSRLQLRVLPRVICCLHRSLIADTVSGSSYVLCLPIGLLFCSSQPLVRIYIFGSYPLNSQFPLVPMSYRLVLAKDTAGTDNQVSWQINQIDWLVFQLLVKGFHHKNDI